MLLVGIRDTTRHLVRSCEMLGRGNIGSSRGVILYHHARSVDRRHGKCEVAGCHCAVAVFERHETFCRAEFSRDISAHRYITPVVFETIRLHFELHFVSICASRQVPCCERDFDYSMFAPEETTRGR